MEQAKNMARLAYEALSEKKGEDIRVINISEISTLADYFIIANGTNESQVNALVENVEEKLEKAGYTVKQREGYGLMDYRDVVIHIFDEENRLFYDLERIWRDGRVVENIDEL